MKIVHISPTYFDCASIVGGGERYPTELARTMADCLDVTLVSFSQSRRSYRQGNLRIEIFPAQHLIKGNKIDPLNFQYLQSVLRADVIHVHHLSTFVSQMAATLGALLGKLIFVTDYGGGSGFVTRLNQFIPLFWCYKQATVISKYALNFIPIELQQKAALIKGGIDVNCFSPDPTLPKQNTILYVGRIIPHKGINYLIEGFRLLNRPDFTLKIVGRVYSDRFYQDLQQQAAGLAVEFIHNADDQQLLEAYRTAIVTVLPSVHTNCYGDYTPVPELMGFTLLESQACGTPVICTNAGAMPEFVEPGQTGLVVAQNSGEAIAEALKTILNLSPNEYQHWQHCCQAWVEPMSWQHVVRQHLALYQSV
ncbi:MAG: glycosyltransferase family 4 protein [Aphanocapsa sp. GSE-SYN-MK-11-07L]|jgi:glycosyltransferase involved in cell wall biosynthesis|nr:glycosyltransferase family 4 protein [Aphanocapsa sp. GSE-SYN-MK-11-07L]